MKQKRAVASEKNSDFIVFGAPLITQDEIDEVVDSLKSGWLGTGPKVARFEENFRKYKSAKHSIAVNSATSALHLSLLAAGIKEGDEVITTPLTFCATVNSIIYVGATPVLADVNPHTLNIDPLEIALKITPKTKAIVPVHFAGRSCDMDNIMKIAQKYNLKVIEDCAHAIETEYHGQKAGNFGDFGCFSFYVTKNVVTGEGGMILTNNEDSASRLKILALHGMSKDAWQRFSDKGYKHYQVVECGFKYNMMDLQAAIGIHQLKKVEENWKRRQQIWAKYNDAFSDLPVTLPSEVEKNTRHAYHLYTILVSHKKTGIKRDSFLEMMTKKRLVSGYITLVFQNTLFIKKSTVGSQQIIQTL